jgi:hypothetical protein
MRRTATTAASQLDWQALLAPSLQPRRIVNLQSERLQSLWASYGDVTRLRLALDDGSQQRFVAKRVNPPRAKPDDVGHARKLSSYACEAAFYDGVTAELLQRTGLALPRPLRVSQGGLCGASSAAAPEFVFVLSDLTQELPEPPAGSLTDTQVTGPRARLARQQHRLLAQPQTAAAQDRTCEAILLLLLLLLRRCAPPSSGSPRTTPTFLSGRCPQGCSPRAATGAAARRKAAPCK